MKKLIAILAVALASSAFANCYSEGTRVGTLQKFSMKGMVNKSWEGELVMDGLKLKTGQNGGSRGGTVWAFSVLDPMVAKVIDAAVMSGGEVALRYCEAGPFDITKSLSTDTPYRITLAMERK